MKRFAHPLALAILAATSSSLSAQESPALAVTELKKLSIEQLLEQEVTTAGRKPQKWSEVSSALHVISSEEIRRSGVRSIPEALRLAPGVQVARVDAHTWAISSRGFNNTSANKLQVMVDGRSVYSPLFSGVFWDVQDTFLEDIDRIEVIRGPGGSVWGANAVNGVINIITKSARETQGGVALGGGGTEERGFGGVRYGGKINETTHYRVYAKYFNRDEFARPNGAGADDGWQKGQTGFRLDWTPNDRNELTLQGDYYLGEKDQTSTLVTPTGGGPRLDQTLISGGNLLGRWVLTPSEDLEWQFQAYYDKTYREIPRLFREDRNTFDFDFQNRIQTLPKHDIIYGGGYNMTADDMANTYTVSWAPADRSVQVLSAFLQDEISLVPDKLFLTIGSKFEHNDYTGFEAQPNARLALQPAENQLIWAAVSRAVRTPSRIDSDIQIRTPMAGAPPGSYDLFIGSPDFSSESLIAYEAGYRFRPWKMVSFDLAAFYNDYEDLRSIQFGTVVPAGGILTRTSSLENELEGETYGAELAITYELAEWWRWRAGYSFLEVQLHTAPTSNDPVSERSEGNDPHHQFFLHSSWDLPAKVKFDGILRYVDNLPNLRIPSYLAVDLRLAWTPLEDLELSVVGQNLLDDRHPEFSSLLRAEVEHSVYAMIRWNF